MLDRFDERTRGKGMVTFDWAPQMEIMGLSVIGGSLFHSELDSVIEALQFGHRPVVLRGMYKIKILKFFFFFFGLIFFTFEVKT